MNLLRERAVATETATWLDIYDDELPPWDEGDITPDAQKRPQTEVQGR